MAIAMASLFLKRGDRLILLFRFPEKRDIETVLKRLLRWRGVTIVSDSERISQNVLPIPHTTAIKAKPVSSKNPTFWWPGPPRLEKGIATILQLAQNAPIAGNLKAPGINYLPELTREQYVEQLAKSDILLLPYDANAYASRTSGPFVEAISAGKIAVVREGTWMAAELEKHNLSELIVDFTSIEQIAKLADNQKVLDKLEKMQQHYLNYHNIDNFSSVLKSLMRW
ncbi:MAG: hypothetical protein S4CHLAM81_08810 [Chlamydiales bacterium]|nr:hypothetical protein [Chlamydiales bacterium]